MPKRTAATVPTEKLARGPSIFQKDITPKRLKKRVHAIELVDHMDVTQTNYLRYQASNHKDIRTK